MKPRLDDEQIAALIDRHLRDPFKRVLALLLACEPHQDDLRSFAAMYPNRWVTMLSTMANLSGYTTDSGAQDNSVTVNIFELSDAELQIRREQVQKKLAKLESRTLEGVVEIVPKELEDSSLTDQK